MNRKLLIAATIATGLALIALLIYSIERTAWLFSLFETWWVAAWAAAIVVELAAVALLIGAGALSSLDMQARAWANRALVAVLSVQALANLTAGYLRGGRQALGLFGASDVPLPWLGIDARYAVAAALWFSVNLAVPGLILCLSKLAERLIAAAGTASDAPLKAQLASLRESLANDRQLLASTTADLAHARQALAQLKATAAQPDPLIAQQAAELAQNEEIFAQLHSELDRREGLLAQQTRRIAQLEEQAAQPIAIDGIDLLAIARRLRTSGTSSRETAELLRMKESTLRNRLKETNGHLVEG